jgi:hypothetical protein
LWYVYFLELKNADIYVGSTMLVRLCWFDERSSTEGRFSPGRTRHLHQRKSACGSQIVCSRGGRSERSQPGAIFQVRFRQSVCEEALSEESRIVVHPLGRSAAPDRQATWPHQRPRIMREDGAEAPQTPTRGDAKKASPLAWKSSSGAIQIRLHTTLTQPHPSRQTRYATPQFTRP